MAVEMVIWRMTDDGPRQLVSSPLDFEHRLEDMLAEDPGTSGTDLLIVGRQVKTAYGGSIDLLALDADGRTHMLELKRDRTPRDVVAQTLDYGSWVQDLSVDDLEQIYTDYHGDDTELDAAFAERFASPMPDVVNAEQQFTIVASELDPTSDRIVEFLAESYGVPINAVFFRHFNDDGRDYLARTWLLAPQPIEVKTGRTSRSKKRPWNGRDFYIVLGRADDPRRWAIASTYGLLNAGGGSWYWKPLRNLTPGSRVFAHVGGVGYVGIGKVTGELIPYAMPKSRSTVNSSRCSINHIRAGGPGRMRRLPTLTRPRWSYRLSGSQHARLTRPSGRRGSSPRRSQSVSCAMNTPSQLSNRPSGSTR